MVSLRQVPIGFILGAGFTIVSSTYAVAEKDDQAQLRKTYIAAKDFTKAGDFETGLTDLKDQIGDATTRQVYVAILINLWRSQLQKRGMTNLPPEAWSFNWLKCAARQDPSKQFDLEIMNASAPQILALMYAQKKHIVTEKSGKDRSVFNKMYSSELAQCWKSVGIQKASVDRCLRLEDTLKSDGKLTQAFEKCPPSEPSAISIKKYSIAKAR